tara:strand:+ start:97 stop:450 length:354 start_codon:yes stop_codon:yes gene_type:complete
MGSFIINKIMKNRESTGIMPSTPKKKVVLNDGKTNVTIDGFAIKRNKSITICAICAKTNCTDKNHRRQLCTSAGYWVEIKKRYNWKIMGRYRLALWIRKEDARISKELKKTNDSFSD